MNKGRFAPWVGPTAIALLIGLWLVATAGARPLLLPDEGRYVGVAWEMLRSGNWATPTLDGLPFFHKPPLFYWITAASLKVFGPHEAAARLAPLAGAWASAFALYGFTRRRVGERQARRVLVALLAQPLFFIGGQFANLDMLVAGCIGVTILRLADAALDIEQGRPAHGALLGAYAMAALGLLAKGLIGAVLPALVIIVWLGLRQRWRLLLRLIWWPGVLVFSAIAVPWFVLMMQRYPGFFDYFFVVQHLHRFASGGFNNVQPFWFYPVLLLVAFSPWLFRLAQAARSARVKEPGIGALRQLMLVWAGVVVVFFSLPQSKLIGYVLPAVPPLAWLAADGLSRLSAPGRSWWAGTALGVLLSLGVVTALSAWPRNSTREIALELQHRRSAGEPVFVVGQYPYDLPFYAGLTAPLQVVDPWSDRAMDQRDNWRKELSDAGNFSAAGRAAALIEPQALVTGLCAAPVSWVVGDSEAQNGRPYLNDTSRVAQFRGTSLWRVESATNAVASALGCPKTPNIDP